MRRSIRPLCRRALAAAAGIAICLAAALPAPARADDSPDAALARVLDRAREEAAAPGGCTAPNADRLVGVLCRGAIRIGVRQGYPLFGTRHGKVRAGYEIDVARAVAHRLGVKAEFIKVKAATRIPMLADGNVDLVIATMGDNTQRETQVRFIRPHYYRSETIVVGPRDLAVTDWHEIRGRTVCATVGNGSNAELVARGARLMLFDDPTALPDRLDDETCTLAAQDDSFFASYFNRPAFAARFAAKFAFAPVPWGMGVAPHRTAMLARALDLMSQVFHRDGVFLALARANHIGTEFLVQQRAVWSRPPCDTDTGSTNPACVLPPANVDVQPTPFAGKVTAFEHWVSGISGLAIHLPMLKTAPAWSLFLDGVINSLVLVGGALAATLGFALLFGFALGARWRVLRWAARGVTITLQSSPIVLTLVIASSVIHALIPYSSAAALAAAILALGLANGSNAGQAISEAYLTLCTERADAGPAGGDRAGLFSRAVSRSATQIAAFLINAVKGTPVASFIGAPELLSALTDITSFSSGRATTYTLLLIFYTAVVIAVVWLCRRFQGFLERSHAAS